MPVWQNNIDDPVLPPAQSFAVVGPMPERLRLAYERQQAGAPSVDLTEEHEERDEDDPASSLRSDRERP